MNDFEKYWHVLEIESNGQIEEVERCFDEAELDGNAFLLLELSLRLDPDFESAGKYQPNKDGLKAREIRAAAFKILRNKSDANSKAWLGKLYAGQFGEGYVDRYKARQEFTEAYSKGCIHASIDLYDLYRNNLSEIHDDTKAFDWYKIMKSHNISMINDYEFEKRLNPK